MYTRNKRGFTLIELLVVIAIIAILAAILFPVFAQARSKARQATGTSNAKQVDTSIIMYVQDYDEKFPREGWDCVAPDANDPTFFNGCGNTNWLNAIYPYTKSTGVFTSPGDSDSKLADGITNMDGTTTPPKPDCSLLINDILSHDVKSDANGYAPWDGPAQAQKQDGISLAAVNGPADCVTVIEGHCGWDKVVPGGLGSGKDFTGSTDTKNAWHRENSMSGGQTHLVAGVSYGGWGQQAVGVPFYNDGGIVAFSDGHAKYIKMRSGNKPTLCSTLPWTKNIDPLQRNADKDSCNDPLNPLGVNTSGNWQ